MKECDSLGVKTYSDPSYIFQGGSTPATPHRIYAPVKARNDDDDDDDDDDCIGSTLGKLSRVLSRIREIFIETLIKNFTEFFNVKNFVKFYVTHYFPEF